MDICQCVNGDCDFTTGFCNCSIGFVGVACNMSKLPCQRSIIANQPENGYSLVCPPLRYGEDCSQECTCQTGNCHHITGNCSCPVGYLGLNCDHSKLLRFKTSVVWPHTLLIDCTEAADCGDIGRVVCSLETPEQTCGPCLPGHVGSSGNGNTECICESVWHQLNFPEVKIWESLVFVVCSGAPDCTAVSREPCSTVANTCGPCFPRHLTAPGQEGFSNEPCFGEFHDVMIITMLTWFLPFCGHADPCIDGIMNYDETDIDCGGPLCPPCSINQVEQYLLWWMNFNRLCADMYNGFWLWSWNRVPGVLYSSFRTGLPF